MNSDECSKQNCHSVTQRACEWYSFSSHTVFRSLIHLEEKVQMNPFAWRILVFQHHLLKRFNTELLLFFCEKPIVRTSLEVHWLRLWASNAGGAGSVLAWGIKIPHAACGMLGKNKIKNNCPQICVYFWTLLGSIDLCVNFLKKHFKKDSWLSPKTWFTWTPFWQSLPRSVWMGQGEHLEDLVQEWRFPSLCWSLSSII